MGVFSGNKIGFVRPGHNLISIPITCIATESTLESRGIERIVGAYTYMLISWLVNWFVCVG